jgi:1-pyrroline-4-hydroxy-2-carboxylate deaminase
LDRGSVEWQGYWPAVPTPYSDGGIDADALRRLLDHYIDDLGVHGVLINGTAGEWWSQTAAERRETAGIAVEAVKRRVPVIIGCSSFTPSQVAELAAHAASAGADGVLATPPPYAHPTQSEIAAFYELIDAAIELPLIIYNWPRGTGVEIEVDTALRIAELDHVVALKNSSSNWPLVIDSIEALIDKLRVFAALISPRGLAILCELGGDGYIDGGALGARFAVPFFDAVWSGRLDDARECAAGYEALTKALYTPEFSGRWGSWSAQLKAAMEIIGRPIGDPRPPLLPVTDPDSRREIANILSGAGILVEADVTEGVR